MLKGTYIMLKGTYIMLKGKYIMLQETCILTKSHTHTHFLSLSTVSSEYK
jgi:hypothetical protein